MAGMAQKIRPRLLTQVATTNSSAPSQARQTRAQAVHRLQIGLFGLAAMLLLVGLANIIMDRARLSDDSDMATPAVAATDKKAATDPLADIGVVPAAGSSTASTGSPQK
jgi:hypothetical protein